MKDARSEMAPTPLFFKYEGRVNFHYCSVAIHAGTLNFKPFEPFGATTKTKRCPMRPIRSRSLNSKGEWSWVDGSDSTKAEGVDNDLKQ